MSHEPEEISLTSTQEPSSLVAAIAKPEKPEKPVKSRFSDSFTAGMSDQDVFSAILNKTEDQLLPWESTQLPSRGFYYGWPDGEVKIRPWGVGVDKILSNQRMLKSGTAMTELMRLCVRLPNEFEIEDLLVGDHIYLLYILRGITYGPQYEFTVKTPSGNRMLCELDLSELQEGIVYADPNLGKEPFRIQLPYLTEQTGRDFYASIRFLRVRDSREIAQQRAFATKVVGDNRVRMVRPGAEDSSDVDIDASPPEQSSDTMLDNLHRVITNVMGVNNPMQIRAFVEKMHQRDSAAIREWLRVHTPGMNPIITLTDPTSGQGFKAVLPITESFFRPKNV